MLFRYRRFARAFVLANLCTEELGKIPMLTRAPAFGKNKVLWKKFWRRFRGHVKKRHEVDIMEIFLPLFNAPGIPLPFSRKLKRAIQQKDHEIFLERFKQLGLYVDALYPGTLMSPSILFPPNLGAHTSRGAIIQAQNRLTFFKWLLRRVPPSEFVKNAGEVRKGWRKLGSTNPELRKGISILMPEVFETAER